jgi:hypothetical protein
VDLELITDIFFENSHTLTTGGRGRASSDRHRRRKAKFAWALLVCVVRPTLKLFVLQNEGESLTRTRGDRASYLAAALLEARFLAMFRLQVESGVAPWQLADPIPIFLSPGVRTVLLSRLSIESLLTGIKLFEFAPCMNFLTEI